MEKGTWERLSHLPLDARLELLEVLTVEAEVGADIFRRLYERPGGRQLADLLRALEAEAPQAGVMSRTDDGLT